MSVLLGMRMLGVRHIHQYVNLSKQKSQGLVTDTSVYDITIDSRYLFKTENHLFRCIASIPFFSDIKLMCIFST